MQVVHTHCAGLDVHKKTVVASAVTPHAEGGWHKETKTFGTMTSDLLELSDWLQARHITHVAVESTGDYWKPGFNLLEGQLEVLLVNAAHVKHVPGRKTDVKDAQWLAEWLQHGLLKASFIPAPPIRALRELTRCRSTFVRERATLANRVQQVLESANLKLASVATDVLGVSGRAMLDALCAGKTDPVALAELAKGRMRTKQTELAKALDGRIKPHHRFLLTELLSQIDSLNQTIARFDEQIEHQCRPFEKAVAHLDTIPGVGREIAQVIVAEIGVEMDRFPSAHHLAAWAGVAPGNHESGGKQLAGRIRQGNQALRQGLVQAAHAAAHTKQTFLSEQYHRLAGRRGKKRAIIAVAHSILVIAYHLISHDEDYQEYRPKTSKPDPAQTAQQFVGRLQKLGFQVTLQPLKEAVLV